MSIALIIPLIGQLLTLSLKVAMAVDKLEGIDPEDKAALKKIIKEAQEGVTYWTDDNNGGDN